MNIQRFYGKNSREALNAVKKALGEDEEESSRKKASAKGSVKVGVKPGPKKGPYGPAKKR